jgi:hypothetical protein
MSQYLSFDLVNKTNPEIKVELGYWCTSIARGICYNFDGAFRYTEDDVKLSIETLEDYIDSVHYGIDEYKENLRKQQERKKEYTDFLLRAQSAAAVESIKEDINCCDEAIEDWLDEIETWSMVERKLNFILDLFKENEENWEIVYRNA